MYVACLADRQRKDRYLTLNDYETLPFQDYAWVIDGFLVPPVCHRDGSRVKLTLAEFTALAKLVRRPGVAMEPRRELFEGSNSVDSAIRRFEKARKKVEPRGARRDERSFCAVRHGEEMRYVFQPSHELRYCLVERLDPGVSVSPRGVETSGLQAAPPPRSWTAFDLSAFLPRGEQVKRKAECHLIPKPTPAVEGIRVHVRAFSFVGRYVRARVNVSNATSEPKFVSYFTLHVGETSSRAVRCKPSNRRPGLSRATHLEPVMLVVDAHRAVAGSLFVSRVRVTGDGEATVRPHVVRMPVVD
jgi:hypothetical protein